MTLCKSIDPADHYEAAAEYCAKFSLSAKHVRCLELVPSSVADDIEADTYAFNRRVMDYAYGHSMMAPGAYGGFIGE